MTTKPRFPMHLTVLLFTLFAFALPLSAKTRTAQQESDLKEWIIGIQTLAQDSEKRAVEADERAVQAEAEAQAGRAQTIIAREQLTLATAAIADLQVKFTNLEMERDQAIAEREAEKTLRVAAEKHLSRLKTWLSVALAACLIALVNYLPFGIFPPPTSLYLRAGASIAAAGTAWILVARFV